MAAPNNSHGILIVAQRLHQVPQDDPAAVQQVARDVEAALADPAPGSSTQQPTALEPRDTPACITASMQCAGWLLQAVKGGQQEGTVRDAVWLCMNSVAAWFPFSEPGSLDVLQAILRPGASGKAPGGLAVYKRGHRHSTAAMLATHSRWPMWGHKENTCCSVRLCSVPFVF
jgi:hypothetical protein